VRRPASLIGGMLLAAASCAAAQEPESIQPPPALSADAYFPITNAGRIHWIVDGTIGRRSLGIGVVADLFQTGINTPEEWGRGPGGMGKRYLEREADVAISNTIEAGLGALWG